MRRSDKHIDLTIEILRQAWRKEDNRHLRLCQLIVDANDGEDTYRVEDGILMERLMAKKIDPDLKPCRIPKDLDDCFVELKKMLSTDQLNKIQLIAEVTMNYYHFGFGTSLRNSWGLWGNSRLAKWFNEIGIHHADDMSGIILTSFWRHMNGKEIGLEEQVEHYKEYWKKKGVVVELGREK